MRGLDRAYYYKVWDGSWSESFVRLGGSFVTDPVAVENGAGEPEVFCVGTNLAVYSATRSAASHAWGQWQNHGGWRLGLPAPGAGLAAGAGQGARAAVPAGADLQGLTLRAWLRVRTFTRRSTRSLRFSTATAPRSTCSTWAW